MHVLQTLETHSLVVKNNIQIRGDGARVQTSILHLTRFAPDLAPGLKFAVRCCQLAYIVSPIAIG